MRFYLFLFLFFIFISIAYSKTNQNIQEITIKASRLDRSQDFFNNMVFSKRELSKISSMSELFKDIPSLDFNDYNSPGSLLNVKLNGTKASHVLARFDDVKLNDIFNGTFDFSLIDPEILSSLQISKNSLSSLYGGEAPGGVIDMKGASSKPQEYGVSTGSDGYKKIFYTIPLKTGYIYTSHKQYDGNVDFSNGQQNSLYILHRDNGMKVSYYKTYANIGTPGSSSWPSIGDRSIKNIQIFSLRKKISKKLGFKYGFLKNEMDYLDASMNKSNSYDTRKKSFELDYRINKSSILGLKHEDFDGDGEIYSDNDWNSIWSLGDTKDIINKKLRCNSIYGESNIKNLYLSLRHDDYSEFSAQNSFNTALKIKKMLISYYKGFKIPTFNDLYWPNSGNPYLKIEKNNGVRVSQMLSNWLTLSYYKNNFKDMIEWAPDATNPFKWIPQNIGRAEVVGEEINIIHGNITIDWNWCRPIDKISSQTLLYKQRKSGKISYRHSNIELSYLYHGRMRIEDDIDLSTGKKIKRYRSGTGTWDLSLKAKNMVFKINNLFDNEYLTVKDYPYAKRTYTLSFKYRF